MTNNTVVSILGKAQEDLTDFIAVIQSDHAYIHDGIGFKFLVETGELAAEGVYYIYILTGATKYIHYRPTKIFTDGASIKAELLEGVTYTAESGTAVTPVNCNRLSTITSTVTVKKGATITADGTAISLDGAGNGNRAGGSSDGSLEERVLKQSTAYAIKITNLSGITATKVYLEGFWYEEASGI